jgi:hypothetical protein
MKQKKYLEHTLQIYVYSYRKICNIVIYFCNIDIKYLQHISEISETLEIYIYNMRFQRNISCCFGEWRLPDAWRQWRN